MDAGAQFAQESLPSGPAAPRGRRPSYSYVVAKPRFVQESSCPFSAFVYLIVASHFSETVRRKQAGNDAPRTGVGTVPGTVPGVTLIGVCRWTSLAVLRPISTVRGRVTQRRTCGQMATVTDYPTCRSNRVAALRPMCGVTRTAVPSLVPNSVRGVVCRVIAETARESRAVSKGA